MSATLRERAQRGGIAEMCGFPSTPHRITTSILGICSTAGPPITSRRAYLNFRAGIAASARHGALAHLAKIAAVELGPT